MATIDAHRANSDRAATSARSSGVTVHEVHHQVCSARVEHCPSRAHLAHHPRRQHLAVSSYRAAGHFGTSPEALQRSDTQRRHAEMVVLAVTIATGLVYLGAVLVLEPVVNDKLLLLGVFLIAIGGAVVLNALTVEDTPPHSR